MQPSLLSDFEKTDKSVWKKQITKELKGRSYEEVLYRPAGTVAIEPYYVESELPESTLLKDIQACQKQVPGWLTTPYVIFDAPSETNKFIRRELDRGADAIWLDCQDLSVLELDLFKTLHAIRLTDTPIFFASSESPVALLTELTRGASYYLKGGIIHDPIADWMKTGNTFSERMDTIAESMALTKAMREFNSYKVESHVFHDAGADIVQELAFTLASFVTYMDQLTERGIAPLLVANRFVFSISVGTDYLTEIAKLRALRYLYRRITRTYSLPDDLCHAFIHGSSSMLYQSVRSPHTNILRYTSEAMSGVVGGCDALTVFPFDHSFAKTSEFSERVARNTSLILKNESYMDQVADPAAGSYYLEIMTQQLAEASWNLFLDVENRGGLPAAFEQNFIQEEIKKSWNKTVSDYHNGKVLVGVNKYQVDELTLPQTPPVPVDQVPNWEYALLKRKSLDATL
jgi:methylmalonyl-CoA mutase